MAVTQNTYTGNGSTTNYSFTFPYLETTDIKVSLNGTVTTAYTLANATTIQFNTAPANGAAIRIYRQTDDAALAATFYPGSAIRSQDLNENFTQNLYVTQESTNNAATATTTANTALTNSNTAISTANSAVSTANTASSNASAAVATANTASSNASAAVSTANTASSNATTAVNTANAATATANSAASDAATALSTANAATSTANAASAAATNAVNTANAASSAASSAVSTANTASSNASAAVSTANTASSNATSAVNTANSALSTANAAASAVANAILYDIVANVAAIPGSPANNDAVEVTDSTGIESFTPLTGVPGGFTGNSGLSVRIVYTTTGNTWTWIQYFPNDPETRYLKTGSTGTVTSAMIADGTIVNADVSASAAIAGTKISPDFGSQTITTTGVVSAAAGAAATPSIAFTGDLNTGIYSPGADQVAISTGGSGRLFVDASGNVAVSSGGVSPSKFHVEDGSLSIQRYLPSTSALILRTSSGNTAAPTAISSSSNTGIVLARGYDGSAFRETGRIEWWSDGAISSTSSPGYLSLSTTPSGSTSVQERLRITSAGLVGVGTSSPGTYLDTRGFASYRGNAYTIASFCANNTLAPLNICQSENGTAPAISAGQNSTGTYQPLVLMTSELKRVLIDSSGNVGIGTTSPSGLLHLQGASIAESWYTATNTGGATWRVGTADTSSGLSGAYRIYDATNSAARFLITSTGNVGIGTTSPAGLLHCNLGTSFSPGANWDANTAVFGGSGNAGSAFAIAHDTTYGTRLMSIEPGVSWRPIELISNNLIIKPEGANEKARFDNSGRFLLGTSTPRGAGGNFGGVVGGGIQVETTEIATFTGISNKAGGGTSFVTLGGAVGTTPNSVGLVANGHELARVQFVGADGTDVESIAASISGFVDGTPGANDMPGRLVFSTTKDGQASPTEALRIDSQQRVGIGKTPDNSSSNGVEFWSSGVEILARSSGTCLYVNRNTSDGTIVEIQQDAVQEGSISVSGTTVSYNGAHLSRWSQLPSGAERTEILRGTVLSNIDEMCEWGEEDNEQLNRMKVSDVEGDKNVSGVFQAWDDDDDTYTNDFYCAMTGDFIIRIGAGVTVERGNLLMSAGDGTAKPQDDDIIRSKTIAKVTSTNVSCTYDDGSYCVPCVLMAC